jgi:hypothetical protein
MRPKAARDNPDFSMLTCDFCPSTEDVKHAHLRGSGVNKYYFDSVCLCRGCRAKLRGRYMLGKHGVVSGYRGNGLSASQYVGMRETVPTA